MEKEPSSSPSQITYEQYKSAPRITLEQLLACFPAYESFKSFRKDGRPYEIRFIENEKFIYVCFSPDSQRMEGRIFGGGITYVMDKNTNEIVTEILNK